MAIRNTSTQKAEPLSMDFLVVTGDDVDVRQQISAFYYLCNTRIPDFSCQWLLLINQDVKSLVKIRLFKSNLFNPKMKLFVLNNTLVFINETILKLANQKNQQFLALKGANKFTGSCYLIKSLLGTGNTKRFAVLIVLYLQCGL